MAPETLRQKLLDLRRELNSEKGTIASGGKAQNSGRIRELRKTIARILTILGKKEENMLSKSDKNSKSPIKPSAQGKNSFVAGKK